MKNLNGYLKKILYLFSISILFLFPNSISAENFVVNSNFEHYLLSDSIKTQVILQITSESPRVISYYTASIPISNIRVKCVNYKTNENLECTPYHRGSVTDVMLNLNNSVVRPETPLEVMLEYTTQINEANAYTVSSQILDTETRGVSIIYPKQMGEPFWSSDPIQTIRQKGEENLEIFIRDPNNPNISILFGEKITYRFDINKVFSNTLNDENQTFEIYIPSDTHSQIIIWDEIDPSPDITQVDEDGNYIFKYILKPNTTVDCKVSGYIQMIKSTDQKFPEKLHLTGKTGYWDISSNTEFLRINTYLKKRGLEVDNLFEDIDNLDDSEKELFYRYVYQYVKDRLSINPEIVLGITNDIRKGANTLVEAPDNASPIDYADFYIAILRHYNVPSKLIIGYVSNITGYSADGFFHQWVEYFDVNKDEWIIVDPFLDEYLEKNLFGSPFYDHIAIIKRGKSAVAPKMSFFSETDFIVRSETEKDIKAEFDAKINLSFDQLNIANKFIKGYLNITNTGNTTINGHDILKTNIEDIQGYTDPINNLHSKIILPENTSILQFNIPTDNIDSGNTFVEISLYNEGFFATQKVLEAEIEEVVPRYITILSKLISISIFAVLVFLVYFILRQLRRSKLRKKKERENKNGK